MFINQSIIGLTAYHTMSHLSCTSSHQLLQPGVLPVSSSDHL